MNPPKQKLRTRGEHILFQRLWDTAEDLCERGDKSVAGYFYPYLAASTFAFFAFEGFVNEVGRLVAPDEWLTERETFGPGTKYPGTLGKFRYLAKLSKYSVSTDRRPYQTAKQLLQMRDAIAHYRTEAFDKVAPEGRAVPGSKLDGFGTRAFAHRALVDIEALADGLLAAARTVYPTEVASRGDRAFKGGITGEWVRSLHE